MSSPHPKQVPCFLIEEADKSAVYLRRYFCSDKDKSENPCPDRYGYHNAVTLIATSAVRYGGPRPHFPNMKMKYVQIDGQEVEQLSGDRWPHDDPRWPTTCTCGYVFAEDDTWQLNFDTLYRRVDNGEEFTVRDAPAGSLWNAEWLKSEKRVGPDGLNLMLRLPGGGDWNIDGPSNNGPGWTRSGTPPLLTVTPSILAHGDTPHLDCYYHGFLTNGVLINCD